MKLPAEIERGKPHWKKRQKELLIMSVMSKATKASTGWDVYQKIRKFSSMTGRDVCRLMYGLVMDGYLRIEGIDDDCGYLYCLREESKIKCIGGDR